MVHVVKAEAPLHAQPVLVGGTVAAGAVGRPAIPAGVRETAAHTATQTHAVDGAIGRPGEDVVGIDQGCRHQGAGRAGLHALAAGDASRVAHRVVEVENDLLMVTAARHPDHVVDLYLAARADAQVAVNASIEIDRHGWMAAVRLRPRRARKAAGVDLRALRHGPEFGTRIVGFGARG